MTRKYKHIVDEDQGIVTRQFKGDIYIEDIMESWEVLLQERDLTNFQGIIHDMTDAVLKLSPDDLTQIFSLFTRHEFIFNKLKQAVVSDNPSNVVFPALAAQYNPRFRIKAFSSYEAAKNWILYEL